MKSYKVGNDSKGANLLTSSKEIINRNDLNTCRFTVEELEVYSIKYI